MNPIFSLRVPGRQLELDVYSIVRIVIILTVLLLSALLARRAEMNYVVLLVGAGALLILLQAPHLGVIALLIGTLVVPFSLGTGTQTPLNITALLVPCLLGVWLADMVRRRQVRLVPSRTTLPVFALALSATISLLAGGLPWNVFARTAPIATQVAGWGIYIFSLGIFLLIGNMIRDQRLLRILVAIFLGICALYMTGRFLPGFSILSTMMNGIGSDGSMFWVWGAAMATGQLAFNRKLGLPWRVVLALLVLTTFAVGLLQARDWASGWLPPLVAVATILFLRSWRLGLGVMIAGVLFLLIARPDFFNLEIGNESYSILTRDAAKDILVQQVFPLSPLIGLGPANYYWYTPLYPILGWYVNFNSHNNYVDILLQLGAFGLACFVWLVVEIGWLAWRLRERFAADFAQGYVYACLGGLAGTLAASWLADWLFPFVYNVGLKGFRASILAWIFLGGLVTLEQLARRHKEVGDDLHAGTR